MLQARMMKCIAKLQVKTVEGKCWNEYEGKCKLQLQIHKVYKNCDMSTMKPSMTYAVFSAVAVLLLETMP